MLTHSFTPGLTFFNVLSTNQSVFFSRVLSRPCFLSWGTSRCTDGSFVTMVFIINVFLSVVCFRRHLQGRAERVPDSWACWGWILRCGGARDSHQDGDHHPGHTVRTAGALICFCFDHFLFFPLCCGRWITCQPEPLCTNQTRSSSSSELKEGLVSAPLYFCIIPDKF